MRVLVCGGRDFVDFPKMESVLSDLCEEYDWDVHIIQGAAKGADSLAEHFAAVHGLGQSIYPAKWDLHGRSAGHIRNQQMLDEGKPDLVVAFPGGRGTANMIERSRKAGVEVRIIE